MSVAVVVSDQPRDSNGFNEDEPEERLSQETLAFQRRVSYLCALLAMTNAGTLYLYSAYATQLPYSQTERNLIASTGGAGQYLFGWTAGRMVNKYGPGRVAFVAGFFLLAGYSLMALSTTGPVPWPFFATFYSLVGIGSAGSYNSSLTSCLRNFSPQMHGLVVGLSVSLFGLSAFIFSTLSSLFRSESTLDTRSFLWFMGLTTGLCTVIASLGLRDLSLQPPPQRRRNSEQRPSNGDGEDDYVEDHVPSQRAPVSSKSDAWTLFFAFSLMTGTGLMFINNIGAIVLALMGPGKDVSKAQTRQVSLLSICNCIGRLMTGASSDYTLKHWGTRRLPFLMIAAGALVLAQIMGMSVDSPGILLTATTALVGFCYGSLFSSTPVIVSSWFGLRAFPELWGAFQLSPLIGGYVFNTLFGVIFDKNKELNCDGSQCFSSSFLATTIASGGSLVILVVLQVRRTRRSYIAL
ncbi:major facilitator superfamily domain-containing protein [Gaertneriomyces semiglobifer]|nr:major facilitator superfamily domain-containing protein [Gaertneriomyces semiglobifer]